MSEQVTDAVIDSTFGGDSGGDAQSSSPDQQQLGNYTSAEIWSEAKKQFAQQLEGKAQVPSERPPQEKPPSNAAEDLQNAADEGKSDESTEQDQTQTDNQNTEPEWKPYQFKGKVYNEDTEHTFDTPEQLNRVVAKGLASERLYKQFKDLQNKTRELEVSAAKVSDFDELAKEAPHKLLDLVFEKHISEEQAAEWVFNKYKYFHELAKLTPEQREEKKRLREAEMIIEERNRLREEQAEADRKRKQDLEMRRRQERKDWARSEFRLVKNKYQGILDDQMIKDQIVAVLNMADNQERSLGKPLSDRERTSLLNRYLKHYDNIVKKHSAKDTVGKAADDIAKSAKKDLQTAARSQSTQTQTKPAQQQSSKPLSTSDVWAELKRRAANNEISLRR